MPYQTQNPATGEVEKTFPFITDEALDRKIAQAQRCFESDWRERTVAARAGIIARAAALMRKESERLARLATVEMGKLIAEARGEVALSANILDYYAQHAEQFAAPRILPEAEGATVETAPLGILLAIEPWNFPYYQLARVAGPQLAVGNVVIVKHASSTPQCAEAFADIIAQAGAPDGAYTNIFSTLDQVGRLFEDTRVKGVTVTGSERAGAAIAERAGRHVKKSVLELGGSDPLIVLPDAPLGPTIENAMWGRMNNTGQSCVAAKRVIVVGRDRGKAMLAGLTERMAALKVGDPAEEGTTLGPLSSEGAVTGLLRQIETAKQGGAKVVIGGGRIARPGFYLEATILSEISTFNPIFTQELFGPVISFYVVETEDEAIELANATPFGLGGSIFTADLDHGRTLARRIESGMVFVNHPTWTAPQLPFGGVKNSGYGRELSEFGFGEFANRKLVSVSPVGAPPPGVDAAG
jgi:succinate-semialdehyde dehydrogenase / glutarate-semialdehyde dehydrogenase